jgi:integrase
MSRRTPRPFRPRVVRYHAPDGKRCRSTDPGAVKSVEQTDTWYAKLGGDKVSLETTDEGRAWEELRRRLRRRAEGHAGLADDVTDAARRPLVEHVEDWLGTLAVAPGRIPLLRYRVTHLASLAGWTALPQITRDSCARALARLLSEEDLAPQTRNDYLSAVKQFCRWAVESEPPRLARSPLLGLRRISIEADIRHARRVPTDAEIAALLAYLHGAKAKRRRGMTGPQRSLGYRLLMATGFRAGELRSLSRQSFDLDRGAVTVGAAYSKRRRQDVQQLPAWLVTELREWFAGGGGCWPFPARCPGRVLKADLAAAGVAYVLPGPDGAPLFLDMHALRHWYVSFVANQPGVSPKTLQALARHSSAALSLKVYAHAQAADVREIVNAIPPVGPVVAPAPGTAAVGSEQAETTSTTERQGEGSKRRPKKSRPGGTS